MSKFLLRLLVFGVIFFCIISFLDWFVSKGLRRSKTQPLSSWNDIYNGRIHSDIVINGSSRAFVHISPTIMEKVTGKSVYNLGINGYHFPMQRVRVNQYLTNNPPPEILVQVLDITFFHRRSGLYQYEQFLPYFDRPKIVEAVQRYNGYHKLDSWLPMFRYRGRNDLLLDSFRFHLRKPEYYDTDRGYRGNDWPWDGSFDKFQGRNSYGYSVAIDPAIVQSLDVFIKNLLVEDILPLFVYAPEYRKAQKLCLNRDQVFAHFNRIANKYHIAFIDYSDHSICADRSMFYNSQHLNQTGAERFTRLLSSDIIRLMMDQRKPDIPINP